MSTKLGTASAKACDKKCELVGHMTGGYHRTDCAAHEETVRTKLCARCASNVSRDHWEVDPPDRIGGGPCEACGRSDLPLTQEVWMTPEKAAILGAASRTSPSCGDSFELNFHCPTCGAYPALCCIKLRADLTFPKEPFGVTGNETESLGFSEWHETHVEAARKDREEIRRRRKVAL